MARLEEYVKKQACQSAHTSALVSVLGFGPVSDGASDFEPGRVNDLEPDAPGLDHQLSERLPPLQCVRAAVQQMRPLD